MERCELCEKKALVHCDSDQAKLCRGCDAKVHNANFFLAKHMRVLLYRICNSHTNFVSVDPQYMMVNIQFLCFIL
ncbi:putative transcription factor interactor and regulator Znf-B family [Lupinus albus]|uniref:Putative transcription factor interactor and regulator Znf-B family n=1 Tax=Lupinus albus TaxID=3870 RepID=A0A6A4PD24_LUPAL|nr:putative transcription factor interactor and regulator Znf-B family [Lupinus albus]